MKKFKLAALLPVLGLFISGCVTSGQSGVANRRFHEASKANAVLQFSSWNYTFLVDPPYRENGFLEPVGRENLKRALDGLNTRRDLAVVVIGWNYKFEELDKLVADWKPILAGCGFRRAVFLRSNVYRQLNGSLIVDDSELSISTAQGFPRLEQSWK